MTTTTDLLDRMAEAVKDFCRYYEYDDGERRRSFPLFRSLVAEYDRRASQAQEKADFQYRVAPWMQECFGPVISADRLERSDRFIEESLELVQACGYSKDRAHALVEYVFNRPIGEPGQETGGVMVTLAALCLAHGLDMHAEAETELRRISAPEVIAKIRAKQAAKPTGSALPIPTPEADAVAAVAIPYCWAPREGTGRTPTIDWNTVRSERTPHFCVPLYLHPAATEAKAGAVSALRGLAETCKQVIDRGHTEIRAEAVLNITESALIQLAALAPSSPTGEPK